MGKRESGRSGFFLVARGWETFTWGAQGVEGPFRNLRHPFPTAAAARRVARNMERRVEVVWVVVPAEVAAGVVGRLPEVGPLPEWSR